MSKVKDNHKRAEKQYLFFKGYFTSHNMPNSLKALKLVEKHHKGERRDGDPEKIHLYEVAGTLLAIFEDKVDLKVLDQIVASGLLHDLVEDYPKEYSPSCLHRDFSSSGHDIPMIVMALCKPTDFDKSKEAYQKYFFQIATSIFAVIIKIADRLHNLQTSKGGMTIERIKLYIEEVNTYFYPMIKQAREDYPKFYMPLTFLKKQLEDRIELLEFYIEKVESR